MTRRAGLTLMEVLVTLFILAFGMMAVLTLFPLAASNMFQAIKWDRTAQAAHAADGFFRAHWKAEVVERNRDGQPILEDFFPTLEDPSFNAVGSPRALPRPAPDEASYPVVVDPMGYLARVGRPEQSWFGDGGLTSVPRRNLWLVGNNPPFALRLCSLMDGFGYNEVGQPTPDREMRYNWLWVLQRVPNGNRFAANMTVVVFDFRPHLSNRAGSEAVFAATLAPGSTAVVVPGNPDIKPGQWIMDATVGGGTSKIRQAQFYQVIGVTPDTPGAGQTTLELQSPIRTPTDGSTVPYNGTIVHLPGVSGVSVRPPLASE